MNSQHENMPAFANQQTYDLFEQFRQVRDTELEASDDGTLSHPARAGGNGLIENR
jgi:acyl CoA:acetate/3-ketoacid CoA transferase alpha subunit